MKYIIRLIFLLAVFSNSLAFSKVMNSPNVPISIREQNVAVEKILKEIELQSGYFFVYTAEDLDCQTKVSIDVRNEKLSTVLDKLLSPLGVAYIFSTSNIVLKRRPKATTSKQQISDDFEPKIKYISGVVLNEEGEPISGAIVRQRDLKTNATITDVDGHFILSIPQRSAIEIDYLGYKSKFVNINTQTFIAIALELTDQLLDEVLVVGYGIHNKVNLTGSIIQVSGEKVKNTYRPNMTNVLAGLLPGVKTQQLSGRPGEDGSLFNIRGFGNALIIVDGVERPFAQIDPNEIEAISVIKDASAAVYGYRGANGVILITTKNGTSEKLKLAYNFNFGMQSPTYHFKMMDAVQYMTYLNEASLNEFGAPIYTSTDIELVRNGNHPYYGSTDWNEALLNAYAPIQQHNLNLSGGNRETKYFLSLGYLNQDGIIKTKDNFKRYNFRTNLSTKLLDNFNAGIQIGVRSERKDAPVAVSDEGSAFDDKFSFGTFKALVNALPIYNIYSKYYPGYYGTVQPSVRNPLASVDRDLVGTDVRTNDVVNGTFTLKYDAPFLKGLSLNVLMAYDKYNLTSKTIRKSYSEYNDTKYNAINPENGFRIWQSKSLVTEYNNQSELITQQYSINYSNIFKGHELAALLLWEVRNQHAHWFKAEGEFDIDEIPELNASNMGSDKNWGQTENVGAWAGLVGRFNYSFQGKYLAELGFRYDGSYKYAKSERWKLFPAISTGWRISEESFIKENISFVNNMKLRASYGILGDDEMSVAGDYLPGYVFPSEWFVVGRDEDGNDQIITASRDKGWINTSSSWYTSTIRNAGLEMILWNGLLNMEVDWFYRTRKGLPSSMKNSLPSSVGAELPQKNINSDSNVGFELVLGSVYKTGDFMFNMKANVSYSRHKYLYVEMAEKGNRYELWKTQGQVPYRWSNIGWGYKAIGQFQSYEEIIGSPIQDGNGNLTLMPGDIKYEDYNGDGIIDENDQQPIGRGNVPDLFFGLDLSVFWKGFDISCILQGASNYVYSLQYRSPFFANGNGYLMYEDRWRRADLDDWNSEWIPGRFPALRSSNPESNKWESTFWNQNTSYLRLKSIDLGYTIPRKYTSKYKVEKLRVFMNAYNLFTFKSQKLKGVDPEGESTYGLYYPQMKTISCGVNIEF